MRVGINYPWKNYGWDFGAPPQRDDGGAWGPRAQWRQCVDAEFAAFAHLGLFAVRWFLLADGLTYGVGPRAPHPDSRDSSSWRFDEIPALGAAFLEDLRHLLERARAAKLKLLPSLLDFHFCFPGMRLPGTSGFIKQGRADVINDASKSALFFERVLQPVLALCSSFKDTIYAFELMNEPEWCTKGSGQGRDFLNEKKTVASEHMLRFLREGASRINGAGLRSTVGLLQPTVARWNSPGLGFTLHQFHYYADPSQIPPHNFDERWPLIVGEIATARHRPWPELGSSQTLYERLQLLKQKGYPVTFLWCADPATDQASPRVVDWSAEAQAQVRRFLTEQG